MVGHVERQTEFLCLDRTVGSRRSGTASEPISATPTSTGLKLMLRAPPRVLVARPAPPMSSPPKPRMRRTPRLSERRYVHLQAQRRNEHCRETFAILYTNQYDDAG